MVLKIRKQVGDDYGRIAVDKIRIRQDRVISILFDNKNDRNAGRWIKLKSLKQIKKMKVRK
jgi:hypothetical protein